MRTVYSIILIVIATQSFAQEDSATLSFLNDVIFKKNDTSTIHYTDKVDAGMYDFMLKRSKFKRIVTDIGNATNDTLTLTSKEIKFLKRQLVKAKGKIWSLHLFTNSKRIPVDSTESFLKKNQSEKLYFFSNPIFIRNNNVSLFYLVRLCCGGIYGPVDLSFYKKTEDGWQSWIKIFSGAF